MLNGVSFCLILHYLKRFFKKNAPLSMFCFLTRSNASNNYSKYKPTFCQRLGLPNLLVFFPKKWAKTVYCIQCVGEVFCANVSVCPTFRLLLLPVIKFGIPTSLEFKILRGRPFASKISNFAWLKFFLT